MGYNEEIAYTPPERYIVVDDLHQKFITMINRYCPKMKKKGSIWLFLPEDAIEFTYELESLDVVCLGVEIWYPVGDGLAENYWDDFTVDYNDEIDKNPKLTAQLCRNYIQHDLPSNIQYVSFNLVVPFEWKPDICADGLQN